MNQYYNQSTEDVLKQYNVSAEVGLSSDEVEKRLAKYGLNELAQQKQKGLWSIFFDQFKSSMVVILLIAAIISAILGITNGEGLIETFLPFWWSMQSLVQYRKGKRNRHLSP